MSIFYQAMVKHCIVTLPNFIPVHQKKRPIHLAKCDAIKVEINKLKQVEFIYLVSNTSLISNPVPILKKQGTINVYIDFQYLNKACLKDNFPTHFIDQIIKECVGHKIFSFMDGFSRYNQISIFFAD